MRSMRTALVCTSFLVVGACGGVARPESRIIDPTSTTVIATTSVMERPSPTKAPTAVATTTPTKTTVTSTEVAAIPTTTAVASTSSAIGATSTVIAETIDLQAVRNAMDTLDALFGDLDGHIGSIDLDEGETP